MESHRKEDDVVDNVIITPVKEIQESADPMSVAEVETPQSHLGQPQADSQEAVMIPVNETPQWATDLRSELLNQCNQIVSMVNENMKLRNDESDKPQGDPQQSEMLSEMCSQLSQFVTMVNEISKLRHDESYRPQGDPKQSETLNEVLVLLSQIVKKQNEAGKGWFKSLCEWHHWGKWWFAFLIASVLFNIVQWHWVSRMCP